MADRTMVDYTQKIKPYFEGIAPIEPTTTAASAHAVGDTFYLNGTKVKCTVPISVEDTIAIGVNVEEADDVESEIQAVMNEVDTIVNDLGAKNLLLPNNAVSQTLNGVTFTVNDDGSVTANGTATNDVYFNVANNVVIPKGNYKLNGCPSGGSVSTYNIYCEGTGVTVAIDTGEGADYNFDSEKTIRCYITIVNGTTVDNITFKPMLRPASIKDSTYVPYTKTNRELTVENQTLANQVSDISDEIADMNNILGAKNLLPNNVVSQTINGVTFTANADGTVTVNGTATVDTYYEVQYQSFKLPNKSLILSGCPSGGSALTYNLHVRSAETDSSQWQYYIDYGDSTSFVADNNRVYVCNIGIMQGQTVSNLVFKPMLRLATDADDTYQPYSMTNRELTPYVQAISNPNLLDNPWFTVNQRGVEKGVSITTTTVKYWWDRWKCNINRTFTYNTDNSITSSDIDMWQVIDDGIEKLQGRTITLSLMLADGTIKSGSYNVPQGVPSTSQFTSVFHNDGINIVFGRLTNGHAQFTVILEQNKTIKAVKLEIGSVSTLAMDTAPNYATELAKCQRYFNRIGHASEYVGVGVGQAWNDNVACIHVPLSVPMRAKPSVTQSGSGYVNLRNQQTVIGTVTSYTVDGVGQNEIMLRFGTSNTPLTAGLVYEAFLAGGRYIDLSADL